MRDHLVKEDKSILKAFREKHIRTESLQHLFGHINDNHHFSVTEKSYLKKILTDNINNAFRRQHPEV